MSYGDPDQVLANAIAEIYGHPQYADVLHDVLDGRLVQDLTRDEVFEVFEEVIRRLRQSE